MPQTAAVAASVHTLRNVTIEINNLTSKYCLLNPKVFMETGVVFNPPQPTVQPMKSELCSFHMCEGTATGSVGVMTYDLFAKGGNDHIQTMAIMFSVPFDYNLHKNWFAVGFYPKERQCDQALYKEMYYNSAKDFVREEANGSGIHFEGGHLDIRATMSAVGKAIVKVELWEKLPMPSASHVVYTQP